MGWWAGGLLETAGGWGWGWLVLGAVNPFRSAKPGAGGAWGSGAGLGWLASGHWSEVGLGGGARGRSGALTSFSGLI